MQDIDPAVQRRIGRVQPEEQVVRAAAWLRAAGITVINFDMMYGLPGQSAAQVAATARFAVEQGADRVAVFGFFMPMCPG